MKDSTTSDAMAVLVADLIFSSGQAHTYASYLPLLNNNEQPPSKAND